MAIGYNQEMVIREVLGGLTRLVLDPIDNVWRTKFHIKIPKRGPTDENNITNFGNVIDE
jgi:hypothetical protein